MKRLAVFTLALTAVACGEGIGTLPAGVECSSTVAGGDSVTEALANASPGTCVVLRGGTYTGPFRVDEGVSLVAAKGEEVVLEADVDNETSVVRIEGGAGSGLVGVHVRAHGSIGVGVSDGPATISNVRVSGSPRRGMLALCPSGDCGPQQEVSLRDVAVESGDFGIWAAGAFVRAEGVKVSGNGSTGLYGYGLVANHGASLTVDGLLIEETRDVGILVDDIDGPGGTRAILDEITVTGNDGRGLWAQGLRGSLEDPALEVTGATIEANAIVGLGGSDSVGIIIVDGTLGRTTGEETEVSVDGAPATEWVGDGISLRDGVRDVLFQGVDIAYNDRAQVLIDNCGDNINLTDVSLAFEEGSHGLVVQDSPIPEGWEDELDPAVGESDISFGSPSDLPL